MNIMSRRMLMQEYYKRFYKIFRPFEFTGFCRFTLKNGLIKKRTFRDMVYNIFVLVIANIFASYLIYIAVFKKKYLNLPETITIIHFSIFSNLMLFHITFGDNRSGSAIIESCIDIDISIGAEETKFMRDKAWKHCIVLCVLVAFTQLTVVTYMYAVFEVSIAIHVVGTLYFWWLFFSYDDFCFYIFTCLFVTMRVRYINVALMKITRMRLEYIPTQLLFNSLFWKSEYDEKVAFHNLNGTQDFSLILRKLFSLFRLAERCYRFPVVLGVLTLVMGSFVSVQTFAMYIESPALVLRAGAISSWSAGSWLYLLVLSLQTDLVYRQIEQTKLICAYTQLKPSNTAELFKLTKNILRILEVRDPRMSLFGMIYFDTRLILKLAASTLVYITVQLQLAFPKVKDAVKYDNNSSTMLSDDPAIYRQFLML